MKALGKRNALFGVIAALGGVLFFWRKKSSAGRQPSTT